ncbi:hypothetical protein V8G54_011874 [Vigna mungo]|uniref:Uncharacterized protein n=1 Tax=Vigna mungo TaxID=3915 RepID=A0AAQ3NRY1_VIGMU
MMYIMKKHPKNFEDFVTRRFYNRTHDNQLACKAYIDGPQVGCLTKGGMQDVDQWDRSISISKPFSTTSYFEEELLIDVGVIGRTLTNLQVYHDDRAKLFGRRNGKKATKADESSPSLMNCLMGNQGSLEAVAWEVVATIKGQFLDFNLEDKGRFLKVWRIVDGIIGILCEGNIWFSWFPLSRNLTETFWIVVVSKVGELLIKGLDEQYLMKIFSNGLQEEIRAELKFFHIQRGTKELITAPPRSMVAANSASPRSSAEANSFSQSVTSKNSNEKKANRDGHNRDNFKRFAPSELQEKIKCFCCDEKHNVNHVCKKRQLNVMKLIKGQEEGSTKMKEVSIIAPLWVGWEVPGPSKCQGCGYKGVSETSIRNSHMLSHVNEQLIAACETSTSKVDDGEQWWTMTIYKDKIPHQVRVGPAVAKCDKTAWTAISETDCYKSTGTTILDLQCLGNILPLTMNVGNSEIVDWNWKHRNCFEFPLKVDDVLQQQITSNCRDENRYIRGPFHVTEAKTPKIGSYDGFKRPKIG